MRPTRRAPSAKTRPAEGKAEPEPVEEPDAARSAATSPAETAAYIAEMGAGLAALARSSKLEFLAYLLEVAAREATDQARARPRRTG